jgi:glutamate-1-semialdehyde 2,1-aminomutase
MHLCEAEVPRRADRIDPRAVERFNRIHGPLLDRGLYLPPSAYEVLFLSAAHTPEQIRTLVQEIVRALGESGSS